MGNGISGLVSDRILKLACCPFWHPNGWFWTDSMDGIDWQPV